ncbi:MAG TPA: 30S ribosomal protein S8 [Thermodesulfobacteriota bacterium]|nr:30S ribosomal protein S8 [Thermodesulfobacteriota bacterium]
MTMTDPIADMLTRIRNAVGAQHAELVMPSSSVKQDIARILKEEGYIKDFSVSKEGNKAFIKIRLKYSADKKNVITSIKRASRPGLRRYLPGREIPRVLNGLGIAIISTSRGVMTDSKARELGVGGEIICTVY